MLILQYSKVRLGSEGCATTSLMSLKLGITQCNFTCCLELLLRFRIRLILKDLTSNLAVQDLHLYEPVIVLLKMLCALSRKQQNADKINTLVLISELAQQVIY